MERGSETGVNGLALEREHAEDALVHPVEGLAGHQPLQRLDAEGELPQRERPLVAEAAVAWCSTAPSSAGGTAASAD
jgi:hypothetical protein